MRLATGIAVLAAVNLVNSACVLGQRASSGAPSPQAAVPVTRETSFVSTGTAPGARVTALRSLLDSRQAGRTSVLIVPAGEMTADQLTATAEDMTVMARIFTTALRQVSLDTSTDMHDYGSLVFLTRHALQDAQSIYLQGYGALFTMKVDFPLAPGPEPNEAPEDTGQAEVDALWEQTRREIYEPGWPQRERQDGGDTPKYSAEKVKDLKTRLIAALKHAANIRNLAPEEAVVILVTGRPTATRIENARSVPGTTQVIVRESYGTPRVYEGGLPDLLEKLSASMALTIRARRSDIDAFAKGSLSVDQFRQKVQILTYPLLGRSDAPGTRPTLPTTRGR